MAEQEPALQVVLADQISVERTYWLLVHEDLRDVARVDAVCKFLTRIMRQNPAMMMGN